MQAHTTRSSLVRFAKCGMTKVISLAHQGRGIKGEGLLHRFDCKILKQVQDDKNVSKAHSKELNVLKSYRLNDFKKKIAFTLAEVLITLGIIGIVAAMTIPTLISNYQKKQTVTKLQKAYSTLKNAFELAKAEHGDYTTWTWNQIPFSNGQRTQYFWDTYILPQLKVSKKCFPGKNGCSSYYVYTLNGQQIFNNTTHCAFVLNDGTVVSTWAGEDNSPYQHIWAFVDTNGFSAPNTIGKDIFTMYFAPVFPDNKMGSLDENDEFVSSGKTLITPYGLHLSGEGINGATVEDLLDPNFIQQNSTQDNVFNLNCSTEGYGYYCGAAIKLNGWKFPDNYPD